MSIWDTPINYSQYTYLIGIDPGVKTGLCVWTRETKHIRHVSASMIHEAMEAVKFWVTSCPGKVFIRLEDARKRTWFGESGREQLQGAGSIKRDCKIWEDYLRSIDAKYELVAPKSNKTKVDAKNFKMISKYEGSTNEHSRDAAMLVIGL